MDKIKIKKPKRRYAHPSHAPKNVHVHRPLVDGHFSQCAICHEPIVKRALDGVWLGV